MVTDCPLETGSSQRADQRVPLNSTFPVPSLNSSTAVAFRPINSSSWSCISSSLLLKNRFFRYFRSNTSPSIDATRKIKICQLRLISVMAHTSAVTQAPAPKNRMTSPGRTSSRSSKPSPIRNQITAGSESISIGRVFFLNLRNLTKIQVRK